MDQILGLFGRSRSDGRDEPARRQGIGAVAAPDLCRFRRNARVAGRLCIAGAKPGAARDYPRCCEPGP